VVDDTDVDKLTWAANEIEEAFSQNSRANKVTTVTETPVQNATTNDFLASAINALSRKIDALANDKHRDHAHLRVHNFAAVRALENRRGGMVYVFITRNSVNAR
jgi:hypothetical protein